MFFSDVDYPRTAAALTEMRAKIHVKHESLKTLKRISSGFAFISKVCCDLKSTFESCRIQSPCRGHLSGSGLVQSADNIVKFRAQEATVNTVRNLVVVFCLKNFYHYKAHESVHYEFRPCGAV